MPLSITVIGAGRVGQTLAKLWHDRGYTIQSVVCCNISSARRAVRFIGAGNPQSSGATTLAKSKVFLLTVPDDEIEKAAMKLAESFPDLNGSVALHTSGSLDSTVLKSLGGIGASVGSMHPLLSFSEPKLAIAQVAGGYFCVEGDKKAASTANQLIKALGANAFEIKSTDKNLYHAAAVMASPQLTALLSLSIESLISCGLTEQKARVVLLPLINSTIANLIKQGAAASLTGPVKRVDVATIKRNLDALAATNRSAAEIYRLLSLRAVKLAEESGVPAVKLVPIIKALKAKRV